MAAKKRSENSTLETMQVWDKLRTIDPKYVKPITGKSYKGDSPSPQAMVKKMTEVYGPIGTGWGYKIIDRWTQEFPSQDRIDCYVQIEIEADIDVAASRTWTTIGNGTLVFKTRANKMMVDEDAYKKATTDALTKALSLVGCGADIFLNEFDPRYTAPENPEDAPATVAAPAKGNGKEKNSGKPASPADREKQIKALQSKYWAAAVAASGKHGLKPGEDDDAIIAIIVAAVRLAGHTHVSDLVGDSVAQKKVLATIEAWTPEGSVLASSAEDFDKQSADAPEFESPLVDASARKALHAWASDMKPDGWSAHEFLLAGCDLMGLDSTSKLRINQLGELKTKLISCKTWPEAAPTDIRERADKPDVPK